MKTETQATLLASAAVKIACTAPGMLTQAAADLTDLLSELASELDFIAEIGDTERRNINSHLEQITHQVSDMDDALADAETSAEYSQNELERTQEDLVKACDRYRQSEKAKTYLATHYDRQPHLIDDLLDYTAHLRHTGADRKTIALLELTTSTLKTIQALLS